LLLVSILRLSGQSASEVDSLIAVAEAIEDPRAKADSYIGIANIFRKADADRARHFTNKAGELAKQIGYEEGVVDAIYMDAAISLISGQAELAAKGYRETIAEARRIGYKKGEANGLNGLGGASDFMGDYVGALEYFLLALEINKELNDLDAMASQYNNIGLVYYSQNLYPEAIEYIEQSLAILRQLDDNHRAIPGITSNLGELYLQIGQYELAENTLNNALTLHINNNDRFGEAGDCRNLGEINRLKGDRSEALKHYQKALNIYQEIGAEKFQAEVLIGIGQLYVESKEWRKARTYFVEALTIARALRHMVSIRDASRLLSLVEEELGNLSAALAAQKEFKQAADSILNTEQTRKLTRQEAEYAFQKERDSVEFERQKAELAYQQSLQKQQWIGFAIATVAFFLGVIALISYRSSQSRKRKNLQLRHKNEIISIKNDELVSKNSEISALRETEKQLAEETLELKERELTTVTMLSHEKNNILQQLSDQIGGLTNKVDDEVLPELTEIKQTIKANLNEESWSMFMYQFEKVHPSFFNGLKKNYPSLTQNDLRICAYIKVGMENKEIASVSNITPAGVKKSINRMKKKMGFTAEVDLREVIMGL